MEAQMSTMEVRSAIFKRTLWGLVIAVILLCGYDMYFTFFGYSAKKVEKDLCAGRHLIYQDTAVGVLDVRVKCSPYLKGKPIPDSLKRLAVPPNKRLTASQAEWACMGGRLQEVYGTLECATRH